MPKPKPAALLPPPPPLSCRGAPGALRVHPCLGCVRSALAGRSSGECFDQSGGGSRCFRCASGHSCVPVLVCSKYVTLCCFLYYPAPRSQPPLPQSSWPRCRAVLLSCSSGSSASSCA
ncbi:hypothetical protein EJ02DRAFT_22585 [Clathrospora elynae]|uniref:Uncharacterized protein n=1 Tax=Clathrospora elynae TaxID=706981 RepID=A0A6A5SFT8_9PLEO|nr:hypothetical protein EJ02DRAFT_22585 [Clathrospora elynae]